MGGTADGKNHPALEVCVQHKVLICSLGPGWAQIFPGREICDVQLHVDESELHPLELSRFVVFTKVTNRVTVAYLLLKEN